jgi:hypothetical protein
MSADTEHSAIVTTYWMDGMLFRPYKGYDSVPGQKDGIKNVLLWV